MKKDKRENKKLAIGIFDSGIGGLTVLHSINRALPFESTVYLGDTARVPYGTKSARTVTQYALEIASFLAGADIKALVVACNTASAVALPALREKFSLPVIGMIEPAARRAAAVTKSGCIGVIGTRATINSGIYERRIKERLPEAKVYSAACPLLVPLVEEGWMKKPETRMIIKKYLHPLKVRQVDTLILGCTHYPLLKKIIQNKIGKRVNIIDSSEAVAEKIKYFLTENPEINASLPKDGNHRFFVSDVTKQFEITAKAIINKNIAFEHVEI